MEEQKTATICYETVMEAQRAIREVNRYKVWKEEKYIKNKAQDQKISSSREQKQVQEIKKQKKIIEKRSHKQE